MRLLGLAAKTVGDLQRRSSQRREATVVTRSKSASLPPDVPLSAPACLPWSLAHSYPPYISKQLNYYLVACSLGRRRIVGARLFPLRRQPPSAHSMGICSSCLGGRRPSESDVSVTDSKFAVCLQLLTLPCSSQTARTCWETSTRPTMARLAAPSTCPSQTQRSCVASAKPSSASVPRLLSECPAAASIAIAPSSHPNSDTTLIPCCRQLIPVSQSTLIPEVAEQPPKTDEYAHLFNERFRSIRNRPSEAGADNDEDETTWLENAVGNHGEDELEQIKPAKGRLTIQFGAR